jgi:hypothetical protein
MSYLQGDPPKPNRFSSAICPFSGAKSSQWRTEDTIARQIRNPQLQEFSYS